MTDEQNRIDALASFLGIPGEDISATSYSHRRHAQGHGMEFDVPGSREYVVMTEAEANAYAEQRIRDTVWAFTSQWLADYVPDGITAEHLDAMRGDKCESFNDPATALVEAGRGMRALIDASITADGRVHFLDTYDGEEHSHGGYVIVRM